MTSDPGSDEMLFTLLLAAPEQYAGCDYLDDKWREACSVLPYSSTYAPLLKEPNVLWERVRKNTDHPDEGSFSSCPGSQHC